MPTWPVHLAIANKLVKKYKFSEDFIIGNVIPDTLNGFVIPNTSNIIHHTITHYSEKQNDGLPKINLEEFLKDNRKKLDNELILGTYIHLITDRYFNEAFKKHTKLTGDKRIVILNNGQEETEHTPMQIKQQDFKTFGDSFIKDDKLGNKISITKDTLNLSKDLNYEIAKEDILKTVDEINKLINSNITEQEEYKTFTEKELTDVFNSCYELIDKTINELKEINEISKAFEKYTQKYDMNDSDIDYKYYHSYRVMEHAKFIAEQLKLSQEDIKLATITGLYHDIGRFEQDKLFDSYIDTKEFDHGDYGERILIDQQLIKEIPIEETYYNIIAKSVKNHNKYSIEEGLTEHELLHAKLVRDADKLDIIDYMSKGKLRLKSFNYEDGTFEVRETIKEEFFKEQTIHVRNNPNKTNSELAIIMLALVFDLNFRSTAEYILENNILDDFYNILINKEEYKEYFSLAKKHLKEMIKC